MRNGHDDATGRDPLGPWFRRCPRVAVAVALGLFALVFALQAALLGPRETITVAYVLPVSLLAMSFGVRAGLGAGVGSIGLLGVGAVGIGDRLTALEWAAQSVTLLLIGGLIGTASDRLREAEQVRRQAAAIALLQRDAAEVNDELAQGLAATKWLLEAGDTERGLVLLEENLVAAQQLVSRTLGSASVLPGDLRRSRPSNRGCRPAVGDPRATPSRQHE